MSRIEEQLADLLSRTGIGSWSWDKATGQVVWDAALERLFGLEPGEFEGTFDAWVAKLHSDDAPSVLVALERSLETRSALFFDHRCVWPDGSEHWLEARGYPLMNDVGEVTGAAGIGIDINSRIQGQRRAATDPDSAPTQTSVERAWERLAQLQVIAVRLAGAAGVEEVGRVLVDQGSRALGAQGGFFSMINHATDSLQLRAWRGASDEVIEFYRDVPLKADNPAARAARTGEPLYVQDSSQREKHFPGLPHQGAEAFWIQPILVEGEVEAVLGYGYVDPHVFSRDEEELVATIAGMSSESLRRAALHDDAERTARRSAQLESAIAELAAAEFRHDVARTVVESLIPAVGAQKGSLFIVDEANGTLKALAIHGYPEETAERFGSLDLDERTGPTDVARSSEPLIINGLEDFTARYPHLSTDVGIGSLPATSLMLPLIVESHVIGTMSLGWDETHHFTPDELRHLTIVGGICAHALGRANAFENWQNAHARLRSIDQITDAALSELSLEDLLEVLPERIASAIGAVATRIFLVDESREYLEARGSHGAPSEGLARVPIGRGLAGAIAIGGPRLVENIRSVEVVRPAFPDEVVWEAGVPLKADNQVIGVLDVGSGADRPLTETDIELLERAADRIATAISRSRVYELERAARRRSEFIGRLGEIMSGPGGLKEQLEEMARLTATTLADCCVMAVLEEGGAVVRACAHVDPEMETTGRLLVDEWIYHPAAPEGIAAVIRSGRSQHYGVVDEDSPELPDAFVGKLCEELGLGSAIITPLAGVSGPVGAMVLGRSADGPGLMPDDLTLAEDLAGRIAAVVEGRLAFDRHRNTAVTLQRSLLPSSLPRIEGLDVAAHYWPASQAADVGGDFYDVVELAPDAWAVMVGDVSGKGVEASAMTGIARHTARAAARHGLGPSEVLRWIHDAFLDQAETTGSFCTAVVGLLTKDDEDFRFRFAVGGHPLPILRGRGRCTYVGEPGTILGLVDPVQITECEVTLRDDDWLIIYTDGVTDVPVADAVTEEELLTIVSQWDGLTAAEGVAALDQVLADRYGETPSRDDTAVLFIRKCPAQPGAGP